MDPWTTLYKTLNNRKFQLRWFLGISLGSIACTLSMAVGCSSPATASIYTYRVNTREVASTFAEESGKSLDAFTHPDLPEVWRWGYSGVCFEGGACKYGFPPLFTTQELLEHVLDPENDPSAATVIENWNEALIDSTTGRSYNSFVKSSRGAAALLVLTLVVSLVNVGCTMFYHSGKLGRYQFFWPWTLGLLFLDFVFLIGCFALTQTIKDNNEISFGVVWGWTIYEVADTSLGPTFPVLLLALVLKVATLPWIGPLLLIALLVTTWGFYKLMKYITKDDDLVYEE